MSFANPPTWQAGTLYRSGIDEVTVGALVCLCTRSGTSGSPAPAWPSTFGATVTDGTVVWSCVAWQGRTIMLADPYIAVL